VISDPALSSLKNIQQEKALLVSVISAVLFAIYSAHWFDSLAHSGMLFVPFAWLFAVVMWSAFAVVRHADSLAVQLGEPYGTLILTLAVISIEVMMIAAVMVTGGDNPTLARDTMYAVIMIALNGMVGVALLLGGVTPSRAAVQSSGGECLSRRHRAVGDTRSYTSQLHACD